MNEINLSALLWSYEDNDSEHQFKIDPASKNIIIGFWAEDGSRYDIDVPYQLRDMFLELFRSHHKLKKDNERLKQSIKEVCDVIRSFDSQ